MIEFNGWVSEGIEEKEKIRMRSRNESESEMCKVRLLDVKGVTAANAKMWLDWPRIFISCESGGAFLRTYLHRYVPYVHGHGNSPL